MIKTNEKMHIEHRLGPSRTGVYVITDEKTGKYVGKIILAFPREGSGNVYSSLWDWTNENAGRDIQNGYADGYGYDKVSAAIHGFTFGNGDREFTLNCNGNGIENAEKQFREHGYILQWVI